VGAENVKGDAAVLMGSEDFGAFTKVVPGNFMLIGNGAGEEEGSTTLHNEGYDFNDKILVTGAHYFAEIVRLSLPRV
jgi:hippurate hydrolase